MYFEADKLASVGGRTLKKENIIGKTITEYYIKFKRCVWCVCV